MSGRLKKKVIPDSDDVCRRCGGYGWVDETKILAGLFNIVRSCPDCRGTGCIDWLERVLGKRKPPTEFPKGWTITVEEDLRVGFREE